MPHIFRLFCLCPSTICPCASTVRRPCSWSGLALVRSWLRPPTYPHTFRAPQCPPMYNAEHYCSRLTCPHHCQKEDFGDLTVAHSCFPSAATSCHFCLGHQLGIVPSHSALTLPIENVRCHRVRAVSPAGSLDARCKP